MSDDLLELVEDRARPSASRSRGEPAGQLEQPLERLVEVLARATEAENEKLSEPSSGSIGHRRRDPQAGEHPQALLGAEQRRGEVVVDRLGELRRELGARRRRHQVDLRDQHLLGDELLGDAPDQRRLAVPARREHARRPGRCARRP